MLNSSSDTSADMRPRDTKESLRVHLDARTLAALRNESIHRSAEAGRPCYPQHVAAMILAEWSKARAETKARERAQRAASSAEDRDHAEG